MLPSILKGPGCIYKNGHEWIKYLKSIGGYADCVDHDFLSSICFEHFDRFNSRFPRFDISSHGVERVDYTAEKLYTDIRYDGGKPLDFWAHQVDDYLAGSSNLSYPELEYCVESKKWSFCPVVIEHEFGSEIGGVNLGSPIHLIEGTHRVCFINRLYELKLIEGDSIHEILVLRP